MTGQGKQPSALCCRVLGEGVASEVAAADGACTWPVTDCFVNGPAQPPRVYVGVDSPLARQMGLCKGGDGFWCGALLNNGADHRQGCPAADANAPSSAVRDA